ncbi:MAG: PAS domain S-box protein [Rubrobacteraceae bacterium]
MDEADRSEELASILESISDAFFALDNGWRFTYLNAEAERVLDRSREELLGKNVWDEFPEAVDLSFYREYHRALEEQITTEFEEFFPPLETWFEVRAYPTESGLAVYFRDVNQRKQMEEALRDSEQRLRAVLVQYASDIITIVDAEGTIQYESPASQRVLGTSPEKLIGTNAFDRIHPEDLERSMGEFADILTSPGTGVAIETRFRHADGSWRYFEVLSNNLLDDPAVRGVVINSRDITERKEVEGRLARLASFPELNPSPVVEIDSSGELTYTNPAADRLFPGLRAAGTGHPLLADYDVIAASLQEGAEDSAADEVRVGDFYYQRVVSWVSQEDLTRIYAFDISARKRAEETLRRSQASLYEAQRVAHLGSWEYYPGEDRASWSDQLYTIFGLSPQGAAPSYKRFLKFVCLEDRRLLHRLLQESLENRTQQSTDFRIVRADGEVRWVNAQYEIAYGDAGNPEKAIGTLLDITERKEAEQALQASENSLAEAQRVACLGSWEVETVRTGASWLEYKMLWSDEMYRIFGYSPRQFTPTFKDLVTMVHPQDTEYVREAIRSSASRGESALTIEHRILRPDGETRFVRAQMEMLYEQDGNLLRNFGTIQDVTERKLVEEERLKLAAIVESSEDAIIGKTLEGVIESWNPGATALYGYAVEEVRGRNISIISPSEDFAEEIADLLERVARGESVQSRETVRVTKDGRLLDVSLSVAPIRDSSGNIVGVSTTERDVSERKALERQLEHQAFHDPLTDLPNRTLFADRLQHALARRDPPAERVAVLFLDLDNFKVVNDSRGHAVGDQLLAAVANRLESCLRPEDTIARFSGDEFVVLLEGARVADASSVADRLVEELKMPFMVGADELFATVSIGIAIGRSERESAEDLMRHADAAMYQAKFEGKSNYKVFRPSMKAHATERLEIESDLRRAVERREFVVYYQPKVQLESGRISGVEALIRWEHPERGLVLPMDFIPLAEETGLIVPIGQQVVEEALRQASVWHERYPADQRLLMCVNLSARQFQHPDLVQDIFQAVRETGMDPTCLDLEITESIMMRYGETNVSKLRELRDQGAKISIDDFGTGYSSLAHLQRLPVDHLKIDRSFVDGFEASSENETLVSTVINLAHALGLSAVAEGVENREQLARLRELKCDLAQGYYFAKPQDSEATDTLLAENLQW